MNINDEEAKRLHEKWSKTGLLDGLARNTGRYPMAILIESKPRQPVKEDTVSDGKID